MQIVLILLLLFFGVNEAEKKQNSRYFYDQRGVLHINGSFPGMSEPIAVDKELYRKNECYPQSYFTITFCAEKEAVLRGDFCEQGMTFCYQGQLAKGTSAPEFIVDPVDNVVSKKCEKFHGFQVSLRQFPAMKQFLFAEYHNAIFFEVRTSFIKEPYYFPTPADLCIDLYLGDQNGILSYVTNRRGVPLEPYKVDFGNNSDLYGNAYNDTKTEETEKMHIMETNGQKNTEEYLTLAKTMKPRHETYMSLKSLPSLPDVANQAGFQTNPDLQMLYMDFKAPDFEAQYIIVIGADSNETACSLEAVVIGNTVGTCKTAWRQRYLTLRSYGDPESTTWYSFTLETGVEQSQKTGQKRGESTAASEGGEDESSSSEENFIKTELQNEEENSQEIIDEHGKTHTDIENWGGGGHLSGNYGRKSNTQGNGSRTPSIEAKLGYDYNSENSVTEGYHDRTMHSTREYSSTATGTSTSSLLENSLKHTWENTNTVTKNTFSSYMVTTTQTTKFKWRVLVPAGHYLTPMQMKLDCQGRVVKIPWIRFMLWKSDRERPVEDYVVEKEQF